MSVKKISMKEKVKLKKEELENMPREYGKLTISVMKEAGIGPFDLFDLTKKHPILKDYPIDLTWDKMMALHNALIITGPKLTNDTFYFDAMKAIGEVFEKVFLVENSVKS